MILSPIFIFISKYLPKNILITFSVFSMIYFSFKELEFVWNVLPQKLIITINRVTTKRLPPRLLPITILTEKAKEMQKKSDHLHHVHRSYWQKCQSANFVSIIHATESLPSLPKTCQLNVIVEKVFIMSYFNW